jgi:tetratricopeptide (TPR) repeat protein
MSDEIMAALAKVQGLSIVARESAHQYKGERNDMRAVGRALNAKYLINGSVRRAGNRVRITAQLVRADDGVGLWTDSYDRELTDVFAIQEDIAHAIAASLSVPLGLQQGETLVSNRTGSSESYDQYLRARAFVRARALPEAIELLESVVARDSGFAPAWGLLAHAYGLVPNNNLDGVSLVGPLEETRRIVQTSAEKAERAAREAIRLDSRNALAFAVLARTQGLRGEWAASEDLYKQALALDPNEPEVLHAYSNGTLAPVGRLKDALSLRDKLRTLEPFVPIYNIFTASIMMNSGQRQTAIAILEATPPDAPGRSPRDVTLARTYAAEGRYAEAADLLLAIPPDSVNRRSVEDAARLLRSAPTRVESPDALPVLERGLEFVYAYVGAPDRVLDFAERRLEIQLGVSSIIWLPELVSLRNTERFKAFARKAGLVDYWRERGWPDLCRPVGADDFVCD